MSDTKKHNVICIGSAGRDVFFPTGEGYIVNDGISTTPQWCFGHGAKIHIEDRFQAPGGCACNVSVGLARLGVPSAAYGVLGADADGDWIRGLLEEDHVDTSFCDVLDEQSSDMSMILVDKGTGERTIFSNRDVGEFLHIKGESIRDFVWAYVGSMYGEHAAENLQILHDEVVAGHIKLGFNPGMHNIETQGQLVWNLMHHAHLVFVNKVEAQKIVSQNVPSYNEEEFNTEVGLLHILAKQTQDDAIIVLTRGGAGAWVWSHGDICHIAARTQKAIDTTGAGDAFASGFLAAQLHDQDIQTSLTWGAANSHSVIGEYGAQKGLVSIEDIEHASEVFDVSVVEQKK